MLDHLRQARKAGLGQQAIVTMVRCLSLHGNGPDLLMPARLTMEL